MTAHTKSHDRTFGYDIGSYRIRYNAGSVQAGAELLQLEQNPTSSSVYADDMWRVQPRLLFETGLRGDALTGRGWSDIEPRASAKFFVTRDLALTGPSGNSRSGRTRCLARTFRFDCSTSGWRATPQHRVDRMALHPGRGAVDHADTLCSPSRRFIRSIKNLLESNPQQESGKERRPTFFVVTASRTARRTPSSIRERIRLEKVFILLIKTSRREA